MPAFLVFPFWPVLLSYMPPSPVALISFALVPVSGLRVPSPSAACPFHPCLGTHFGSCTTQFGPPRDTPKAPGSLHNTRFGSPRRPAGARRGAPGRIPCPCAGNRRPAGGPGPGIVSYTPIRNHEGAVCRWKRSEVASRASHFEQLSCCVAATRCNAPSNFAAGLNLLGYAHGRRPRS